jgi:hypothetical protein
MGALSLKKPGKNAKNESILREEAGEDIENRRNRKEKPTCAGRFSPTTGKEARNTDSAKG